MSEPSDDLTGIFRDEANGRLAEMDEALLSVEAGQVGADVIDVLFRDAHTIKGAAGMLGLADIGRLASAVEDALAQAREIGTFPAEMAEPLLRSTGVLRALVNGASQPIEELIGELAPGRVPSARTASDRAPSSRSPSRESAGSGLGGRAAAGAAPAAGARPGVGHAGSDARAAPAAGQSGPLAEHRALRIPAEKIDRLLDVVGEVMEDRRRLAHALAMGAGSARGLPDELGPGDRVLSELRDTAVGMRTLPVARITRSLPRAVRDLAVEAGREVDFVVEGAETEIDRVILESLAEPLTHLLRNAVVHGVEPPDERERAGKPRRGRVELRAAPRGGLVEVAVSDDGAGVAPDVAEASHRDGPLVDVLARAGYSTAHEVTNLAGRGVGLDAVKAYAQSLGGSLEIRSEPGRGFEAALLLPLALSLLEVLLFERGRTIYGVPLAVIEEVVMVGDTLTLEGTRTLDVRGRSVPVADIAELMGGQAPPGPQRPPALVISAAGRRVAVTCDALLGREEVVVKPLGPLFAGSGSYLGAAMLGDGRIALLVDPAVLTVQRRSGTSPGASARPRPKILVVEDSFTVRELQRSILETAGYLVVTARDGREGLAALDRDAQIALVVTDLDMPELDGLAMTRAIRANPGRSSLPVVIVTAHASENERRQGIEAGADAYMAKRTFDQHALLDTVERLVGR